MNTRQMLQAMGMIRKLDHQINAFECAIAYREQYEERIDWHEFSNLLDILRQQGWLKQVGHTSDGAVIYKLA